MKPLAPATAAKAALAGLAVLLVLAAGIPYLGSEARYSAYDDRGPEDLVAFRALAEQDVGLRHAALATGPLALAMLPDAEVPRTLYVAVGVQRAVTGAEADALLAFVERGGAILVADDFGHGGDLAAPFGVQLTSRPLWDERSLGGDPGLVEASMMDGAYPSVLLNLPATVAVNLTATTAERVTVLGRSSNASFVDLNGDNRVDSHDQRGPFTVAVELTYASGGRAIFVSDSGLFLDAPMENATLRNAAFTKALLQRALPDGGIVLFDESRHYHAGAAPAVGTLAALVKGTQDPLFLWPLVGLLLAGGAYAAWRWGTPPDWRHNHRPDAPTGITRADIAPMTAAPREAPAPAHAPGGDPE